MYLSAYGKMIKTIGIVEQNNRHGVQLEETYLLKQSSWPSKSFFSN